MKSTIVANLLALAALVAVAPAAADGQVEGVRMHEAPDYTRVVFDTSAPVDYELFTLDNPRRVVIDLKDTRPRSGFDPAMSQADAARVTAVRAAPRGSGYRVVLDLARPVEPKTFTLEPVAPYGHRLVVDLYGSQPGRSAPVVPVAEKRRDVVVAIDPGHGGEDPGAIGPARILEKDVVMSISRRLGQRLNAMPGYRAVLIRDGDYYVALRDRVRLAREQRADLFVSVHADAFKTPSVSGASVYTLSNRGATSETARWLAEKENRADLIGGVGDVALGDKDDMLAQVLLDLSMDATRSSSFEAGARVLGQLGSVAKLHKRSVEQAGFVVLKAPDVPSILVETGYISNPTEARRLNTAAYQERLAAALANGVRSYMDKYAPPGTLVAWQQEQGERRYTIERGDTLSEIALRYGISATRLREVNGLNGNVIRTGQTIVIPAG
ncbi:MAG: N-acetylmuramoyl-L-alanine amidase [Gammaproteobacteria bacterium]|nr:N-acetylmuramoyl-L-alanine amidase [Gammaproteobacteria bacterium]